MNSPHRDRVLGAEVRATLNHPVIDADGHAVELALAFPDFNAAAMAHYLDPRKLDVELLVEKATRYPTPHVTPERVREEFEAIRTRLPASAPVPDDFAPCRIERGEDIGEQFTKTFFFGCEANDRMCAVGFDPRFHHHGARFKAVFSSDIGHWDVQNALGVLNEAYELREHTLLSERDFEDFTFANAVRLNAGMNPDFFKGTAVEAAAAKVIAADRAIARAAEWSRAREEAQTWTT